VLPYQATLARYVVKSVNTQTEINTHLERQSPKLILRTVVPRERDPSNNCWTY